MRVLETISFQSLFIQGDFEEIFPAVCKDNSGGLFLYHAAKVNDPLEGFLKIPHYRWFLVRAEIRLKLQDNERWTVSVKRKTATCTVCSTLLRHASMFDVCSGS